jgi:phage replication O-like protein O
MANPQSENGHVDIANEIVDALAGYRIPGEAMQCLWVVFRKTYGWHKVEDEISLSQFSALTGLSRSSAVRGVRWLVTKKVLLCYKEVTIYANKYKFNKNFDLWEVGHKKDTTKKVTGVTKKEPKVVTKKQIVPVTLLSHTKETSTKETSKGGDGIPYQEIVDYLNLKAGGHYQAKAVDTREHIAARWKDGATLEDFKKCIDNMTTKWKDDPKMSPYLRPTTLFAKGKFEGYVNQIISKEEKYKGYL